MANLNVNFLDKSIIENKVSHAYLFETDYSKENMEVIIDFITKIFLSRGTYHYVENLKEKICNNNYPDLKIIKRDGQFIKKEQILSLKEEFSVTAVENDIKIYLIYEAEKMNASAANTLLKFLEEPDGNIIGILLTSNTHSVLKTLVSRCQNILLNKKQSFVLPENFEFISEFLYYILLQKLNIYSKLSNYNGLIETKDVFCETLRCFLIILYDIINKKINNNYKYIIANQYVNKIEKIYSLSDLSYQIDVIIKLIDSAKYNLNQSLYVDRLIILMCGVDNNDSKM